VEALDLNGDEGFRVDSLAAAFFHMRRGHLLQVVDVVDEDTVELVHLRIDVARNGNIDEKHRPVAAAMEKCLAVLAAEDRQRSAGGADDDVGFAGGFVELFEADDFSVELAGECACALFCPITDEDGASALLHKMAGGELAHLACADKKNSTALQRAEDFLRHFHGDRSDGNGVRADAGFAAGFFCGGESALQEMIELAADSAGGTGHCEGFLDLPKDLRLADDHGVEAGGHAEEVGDGFVVTTLKEMWKQKLRFDAELTGKKEA
jgi:hypothetical protein